MDSCVFDNFTLINDLFAKTKPLQALESFQSAHSRSCEKLVSLVPIILRVTSVAFYAVDFNILSCEFDNFKVYPV